MLTKDCWHPDQRRKTIGNYSLALVLGLAVGPTAGGVIAEAELGDGSFGALAPQLLPSRLPISWSSKRHVPIPS